MNSDTSEIKAIIATELVLHPEQLDDQLTLDAIGFDSLQATEIILAVEKKLGRELNAAEISAKLHRDLKLADLLEIIAKAGKAKTAEDDA